MLCFTLLLLSTHTQAHSRASNQDLNLNLDLDPDNNHDDASCTPAEVDPSPIQHLYAEDGMEVNFYIWFTFC